MTLIEHHAREKQKLETLLKEKYLPTSSSPNKRKASDRNLPSTSQKHSRIVFATK